MQTTNNQLTVIIPTYNRKNRLINLLNGLLKEDRFIEISIKILDNASSYDIENEIYSQYKTDKLLNLEIIKQPFNIGMAVNIVSPFLHCKTKWLWIIGDDDEVMPGCLNKILTDIDYFKDYGYLKYEFVNPNKKIKPLIHPVDINSIDDYLNFYDSGEHSTGNMIFLSNNIFNIEILYPYLGKAFELSYSNIGHIIPVIYALIYSNIKCKFLPFQLVRFNLANTDETWNRLNVLLSFTIISDIDWQISKQNKTKLYRILSRNFTHDEVAKNILFIKNYQRREFLYKRIYNSLFKFNNKLSLLDYCLFYFNHFLNINIYLTIHNTKKYIKYKYFKN